MAEAAVDEKNPERPASASDDPYIEEDALVVDADTLSRDFAALFRIDTSHKTSGMESSIEDMLARLDEYYQLVERIHCESAVAFDASLPELQAKCDELAALFRSINQLETFVAIVRENVNQLEEKVNAADKELSVNPIKRVFQKVGLPSFLKRRTGIGSGVAKQPAVDKKWQPPEIFHTDDYLGRPP